VDYVYSRSYRGGLKAVVFDWAGTMIDFGSFAPVAAFLEVFRRFGVPITPAQAREPMGSHKKEHIRAIARMDAVVEVARQALGKPLDEADIEALYRDFLPLQIESIQMYSRLIPGAIELAAEIRRRELRIGSTTGYTREMMDTLLPSAEAQGYSPDATATASDVPAGRPAPWMLFRVAIELGVYPMAAVVKIGDTPLDVEEGLSAGTWTIALARCGNEVGLTEAELALLPDSAQRERIERARKRLAQAGAHYVVDDPLDCLAVLDEIEARVRRGERP
jgi:phosphonoacetaldehyde hydrolase